MEGAVAETVHGLTAKDEDYPVIWDNLSRRFGHTDEPEWAKWWFDTQKQLESETIEGLHSIFREAWPDHGDPESKENDSMLQCPGASIPMGQGGHVPQYLWRGDIHGNVPQYFRSDVV